MIRPIQTPAFLPRPTRLFNEGAGSIVTKILAIAAAAFASLASFLFLPAEAAVLISAGTIVLASAMCCNSGDGAVDRGPRWFDAFHFFVPRGAVAVADPRPRVPVGGIAPQRVVHFPAQDEVRPVAAAHRVHPLPGAVPVLPPFVGQAGAFPAGREARVPVGDGERRRLN